MDPSKNLERRIRINGSEGATVVGENPYETPADLMFKKCFDMPFLGNECTEYGKKYEPVALERLAQQLGCKLEPIKYATSEKYPWLGGTIDALLSFADGTVGLAEVKCPMKRVIKPGQIPWHYYIQPQMYLLIWNTIDSRINKCWFTQYKPAWETKAKKLHRPETLDITIVDKDDQYMLSRLPVLKTFWDKMFSWKACEGRYLTTVACDLLKQYFRSRLTHSTNSTVVNMAKRHWICRLKATAARRYLEIPYQRPIDLRIDFIKYCLAQSPELLIETKRYGVTRKLVQLK